MKERITLKGLEKKFNKELGYNFKPFAFSCILDALEEEMLFDLSIDDINIYPGIGGDCVVNYYGLYHLCSLYDGIHY
jgi:hypothetical protein